LNPTRMKKQNSLRPHQSAFVLSAILSVALWFIPFLRWITVPLQYVNTHVHEGWHALTAVATGGMVGHIQVHANGNGETFTAGGWEFLISSAGYLGAALTGGLMILFARTPRSAKLVLILLGLALSYSLFVWVRSDLFGIASCAAWIVGLFAIAFVVPVDKRLFIAQFLGIQQCLNAVQSLFFLVHISGFGEAQSDAGNMQQFTHIPAIIWAGLWTLISLGMMFVALRLSWRSGPAEATAGLARDLVREQE
jgi:hypothetical protein